MRVQRRETRVESLCRRPVRSRLAPCARGLSSDLRPLTSCRCGLTLIELLIVIIILSTLVSAAIPILAPSNDDRRLREASRGVNSFIAAAQMRAIQSQRPFGVAIKRLSQDTNAGGAANVADEDNAVAVELLYVEQPAPYRGFDRTSAVMVCRHTNPSKLKQVMLKLVNHGDTRKNSDFLPQGWDADLFPPGLIRPGDVMEVDGTRYLLLLPSVENQQSVRLDANGFFVAKEGAVVLNAEPINDTGQMLNIEYDARGNRIRDAAGQNQSLLAPYWTNPAPYKILRQPMPTSDEPFQLPEGTSLDLRASGLTIEFKNDTASGFFYNPDAAEVEDRVDNGDGIVIMFTPEGAVERLRLNTQNVAEPGLSNPPPAELYDERTTSNIYLLIGRRENSPPPALASDVTLDPMAWANLKTEEQQQEAKETVNWLRGESRWIVIGSQSGRVATVENAFVNPGQFLDVTTDTKEVRRARQINAAREFARELTQVGGR